jgi:phospholipase C
MLTKSLVRNALLLGAVGVACVAAPQMGCSSGNLGESGGTVGDNTDRTPSGDGTVGMRLTLPGGSQLDTVSWAITGGPTGATSANPVQSNTVNVTNSLSVSFSIGGLPAGSGYVITLSGTTTNGQTSCGGSATFSVQSQATTSVSVQLACSNAAPDAGSAAVSASTFDCATVQSLSAVPTEVIVGNPVSVTATATGPNPAALAYAWTAPSGSFSAPSAQTSNFTCSVAGSIPLTVTVTDGAIPSGSTCPTSTTSTVNVQCDGHLDAAQAFPTATKIKHVVVIFNENNSFDHYFGTYPQAQNNPGETPFYAQSGTPVPNNLVQPLNVQTGFTPITGVNLLTSNPTAANSANGASAINPLRLAPAYAETSSQNHKYGPEQEAADNAAMDLYPKYTGTAGPPPHLDAGAPAASQTAGLVMAYYDGNTLGTYWNWAQQYALNDNMFTTAFGPSTPGALNVVSGCLSGLVKNPASTGFSTGTNGNVAADGNGGFSVIGDIDPTNDACSTSTSQGQMAGENIGTLLNGGNGGNGITWGWFQGGFNLTLTNAPLPGATTGTTGCGRTSIEGAAPQVAVGDSGPVNVPFPATSADYVPHHNPFAFYPATANSTHARPGSCPSAGQCTGTATSAIGYTNDGDAGVDPANHNYDTYDWFATLAAGNLPAVSYLKPPAYENGHPSNSDPIDEQAFAATVVAALQNSQEWASTLVIITYDDSDGWYDHQAPPIVNESTTSSDFLNGAGLCNSGVQQNADGGAATTMLNGVAVDGGAFANANGRCGYGTRVPLMVISPFAKRNFIDHTLVDQSSVVRFIEDNWLQSARIPASFDAIAGSIQNMLTGD